MAGCVWVSAVSLICLAWIDWPVTSVSQAGLGPIAGWCAGLFVEHPVGFEPNSAQLGRLATRPVCLNAYLAPKDGFEPPTSGLTGQRIYH
jgi:hypothetical protein